VECWNRPCDVFVIKSQQDYYNWRADYYNTTFASPNMYFYSRSYEKQIDYQTATDVVLVVSIHPFHTYYKTVIDFQPKERHRNCKHLVQLQNQGCAINSRWLTHWRNCGRYHWRSVSALVLCWPHHMVVYIEGQSKGIHSTT